MKKKDLKTGDKITYRGGDERIVILNTRFKDSLYTLSGDYGMSLNSLNDDLTSSRGLKAFNVVKVESLSCFVNAPFSTNSDYKTIWERQNEQHIEIQKELNALTDKAKAAGMNVTITIE